MSAQIQQQVLDGLQQLSSEDQQTVLNLVISLQNKHPQSSETPQSFLDVAGEYVGRGEGASDLSTNPEYMEGYGENASTGHS
ncbi:hypothetical protein ACQ4M3_34910 [Leptolyngbya sp. AN03gr2]|uniref:hypothetical protein n=1 Tax=unclassified Leptolyngbya TaxID=2650499 RepID=UPI003D3140D1